MARRLAPFDARCSCCGIVRRYLDTTYLRCTACYSICPAIGGCRLKNEPRQETP